MPPTYLILVNQKPDCRDFISLFCSSLALILLVMGKEVILIDHI